MQNFFKGDRQSGDETQEAGPIPEAGFTLIELLFFAYRDFTAGPDAVLAKAGFGRAHHRVLHFVSRNPGIRVTGLLDILQITKQSLARVLKQLVHDGLIEQRSGHEDRRERLLYLTDSGTALVNDLAKTQHRRIENALSSLSPSSRKDIMTFLFHMIDEDQRAQAAEITRLDKVQTQLTGGEIPIVEQLK